MSETGWSGALARAQSFLAHDLWNVQPDPRSWTGRGLALLQFGVMSGEGFVRDQLLLRSSALTYFTVLAIVPILAIVGAVATALGVTENVVEAAVQQISGAFPEAAEKLLELAEGAQSHLTGLGTLGAVTLLLTTVLGISNIERALNHIWGVKHERPWARRIPDYLAVLIIAPLLLGAGLSLATTVKSQWIVQRLLEYPVFETFYHLGLKQAPSFVLAGAFAFLYWFMPNTTVRPVAALLGGVIAAVAANAALGAYVGLSVGAARANALYGGFAQFPLFFVWVYIFWAIVLFGAEIAFAYQNLELYRREVRGRRAGPAEREAVGLRIALVVARAFRDDGAHWTADGLSDRLRVPVRTVRDVLAHLEGAGIVARRASERGEGVQLGRPAESIQIAHVLAALRGARDAVPTDSGVDRAVETVLAELHEGETKSAGGHSLADLLAGIAPEGDGSAVPPRTVDPVGPDG